MKQNLTQRLMRVEAPVLKQFTSSIIITGRYGPNAFSALEAAGIQAYEADEGTPDELLDRFLAGDLKRVDSATGPELHHKKR